MGVAGRDRVADAEQPEPALRVRHDLLRTAHDQVLVVHLAPVAGGGFQVEVELVERPRAVVDHHLIDPPSLRALP